MPQRVACRLLGVGDMDIQSARMMRRKWLTALAAVTLVGGLGGCDPSERDVDPEVLPPPGELAKSDKERLTLPAAPGDLAEAVRGQNDLGLELFRKLGGSEPNLFLSPVSISTALSMTYAGAAGDTALAFEQVLGSGLPPERFHRAMNELDRELAARGTSARAADGKPFRLRSTNQLFTQVGFPLELPFLDTLALEYGAGVRLLDFSTQPEPSREAINGWVDGRTEGRIPELLPQGTIDSLTRLVLVNAIYFNAAWKHPFEENATVTGDFHTLAGGVKQVPFMRSALLSARAAEVNGTEVVELAYDGDELSMLIVMPPAGGLPALEASLDSAAVEGFVAALKGESLDLSMPAFETRTSADLSAALQALGLANAFGPAADFTGMNKDAELYIGGVIHEAFVKVNEAGTEAAAATAVVIRTTSVPQSRPVVLDRPFFFAIRDHATGALLFVGRIGEP